MTVSNGVWLLQKTVFQHVATSCRWMHFGGCPLDIVLPAHLMRKAARDAVQHCLAQSSETEGQTVHLLVPT